MKQKVPDIVGDDNVSKTYETCMIYSKDVTSLPEVAYQIISPKFDIVTQPVNVQSLQNLVLYAKEHDIPIVPRGNGTSGWGGAIPTRGGLCVALTGMTNILYFNEFEQAITVEAGITWGELLTFLERLSNMVPVYPSSATAATVGGFVASGGLGIGSTRYGNILKHVLGIEAILPNGKIVRLGKLLIDPNNDSLAEDVKEGNEWLSKELAAAGLGPPDQEERLFTGTYGTLGIITKVTLRTIPKLQLIPFACTFENMDSLVQAGKRIISEIQPYHLRFLADNYTDKLDIINLYEDERNKYILTGALLNTIFQNEEDLETLKSLIVEERGVLLDDKRSQFYWDERLFTLRIKRHGPSIVPAEMLVSIDVLPEILEKTKEELRNSKVAIEGMLSNDGKSSVMVWILDDERKRFSFTIGWYRSFRIAAMAARFGGLPYAVGLWNGRHASKFYGKEVYENLKEMKERLDPGQIMNPVKVFGGRVTIGRMSMAFGFLIGFLITLLGGIVISGIPSIVSLIQSLHPILPSFLEFPILLISSLIVGIIGLSVTRLMTLNQALSLGIPVLRILSKIFRK